MTTTYNLLRLRCGLSIREAATFHATAEDSVKSWSAGRRKPPAGVIAELRDLYATIERVAAETLRLFEALAQKHELPEQIELGLASDDHEAQSLGWPCVGAQAASLGIVAARAPVPVVIVPRGATLATAGAADTHDKNRR